VHVITPFILLQFFDVFTVEVDEVTFDCDGLSLVFTYTIGCKGFELLEDFFIRIYKTL
jgi:hypothetical protein